MAIMDLLQEHRGEIWREYFEAAMLPGKGCCMPMYLPKSLLAQVGDVELVKKTREVQVRMFLSVLCFLDFRLSQKVLLSLVLNFFYFPLPLRSR